MEKAASCPSSRPLPRRTHAPAEKARKRRPARHAPPASPTLPRSLSLCAVSSKTVRFGSVKIDVNEGRALPAHFSCWERLHVLVSSLDPNNQQRRDPRRAPNEGGIQIFSSSIDSFLIHPDLTVRIKDQHRRAIIDAFGWVPTSTCTSKASMGGSNLRFTQRWSRTTCVCSVARSCASLRAV